MLHLVTIVAKFMDLPVNNLSWQRLLFAWSNNGRKVWATVWFLSAVMHRKVMHVHFFRFYLPYLQDQKFAPMATWSNNFSLLWHLLIRHLHISHNTPCLPLKNLHNLCFLFLLGITEVPREIKRNTYAKFPGASKVHSWRCANGQVINPD